MPGRSSASCSEWRSRRALWWAYFDIVAIIAERRLRRADARAQVLIARDSYTYLHLPMITGIILFAIGVKRTLST